MNKLIKDFEKRLKKTAISCPKDPDDLIYDKFCYPIDILDGPIHGIPEEYAKDELIDNIIKYVRMVDRPEFPEIRNELAELARRYNFIVDIDTLWDEMSCVVQNILDDLYSRKVRGKLIYGNEPNI